MATRPTREVQWLRYDYTHDERLQMGAELAQAHNRMAQIDDEEQAMKAQIKERRAAVTMTVGTLSRKLNDGYDMRNIDCDLQWDTPNVGEVTSARSDTGAIIKVRAMTEKERQGDLPFGTAEEVAASVEASQEAVSEYFLDSTVGETNVAAPEHPLVKEPRAE